MASLASTIDPETKVGKTLAKLNASADVDAAKALATEMIEAIKGPEKWPQKTQTLFQAVPVLVAAEGETALVTALLTLGGLAETMGNAAEPFLAQALPLALDSASNKSKAVQEAATTCATQLIGALYPALNFVLPNIFAAMQQEKSWPTRCLAMSLFNICAKEGKQELKFCLPAIIPELTPCMTDTKK
eukprot:338966_1